LQKIGEKDSLFSSLRDLFPVEAECHVRKKQDVHLKDRYHYAK